MKTGSRFPFAVHLVPAHGARERLQVLIDRLARAHGSPSFAPHATLFSGHAPVVLDELRRVVAAEFEHAQALSMDVEGIGGTQDYFTCLFVRLRDDARGRWFERPLPFPECRRPAVGPHLSLLYAELARLGWEALAADLSGALPPRIAFDTVRLVVPGTGNWRDVSSWKIAHELPLA